jgi:tRNA(fMet)-specific endonuclease VapC
MDLILDTNALAAAADGDADVAARLSAAERVAIPVIVLGEYWFGILQSRRRSEYERWLADTISITPVFEITEATTRHYAVIRIDLKRSGKPIPSNDLWIAALCREHRFDLLSRDVHFDSVKGLNRVEW